MPQRRRAPGLRASFSMAGASVIGESHLATGRNNQDAWAVFAHDEVLVAAVSDGCSGGVASEAGAHLAVRWLVAEAARAALAPGARVDRALIEALVSQVSSELVSFSRALTPPGGTLFDTVGELFLFTTLLAVVEPSQTHVFLAGDGACVVNGHPTVIDTTPGLSAPYPVYPFLPEIDPSSVDQRPPHYLSLPTAELTSLALATDGLADLLAVGEPPPLLSLLASDEELRRAPSLLQERLEALAHAGDGLSDDATLVWVARGRG